DENQAKAVYLYKFAELTEWPTNSFSETNAPFVIGILGKDPWGGGLTNLLSGLSSQPGTAVKIKGRDVVLKKFAAVPAPQECQLLFISASEDRKSSTLLRPLKDKSMLTVGESRQFARLSGIIGLYVEETLKFDLNEEAAERANLKLTKELLAAAAN